MRWRQCQLEIIHTVIFWFSPRFHYRFRASEITYSDLNFLYYILAAEDYDYDSYKDESWSWYDESFDYYEEFYEYNITDFNYTEFTLRAGFKLDEFSMRECFWRGRKCYAEVSMYVSTH